MPITTPPKSEQPEMGNSNLYSALNYTNTSLKLATTVTLAALGVVLSYLNPFGYFTIFGAKINPFAHLINAMAGVLLGPFYGILTATIIATIRFSVGIGSILAFPGGIAGVIVVSLVRQLILAQNRSRRQKHPNSRLINPIWAALFEPLGTIFIGGTISAYIITATPMVTFWWLFALSAVPGCILGYLLLMIFKRTSYYDYYLPSLSQ